MKRVSTSTHILKWNRYLSTFIHILIWNRYLNVHTFYCESDICIYTFYCKSGLYTHFKMKQVFYMYFNVKKDTYTYILMLLTLHITSESGIYLYNHFKMYKISTCIHILIFYLIFKAESDWKYKVNAFPTIKTIKYLPSAQIKECKKTYVQTPWPWHTTVLANIAACSLQN